MDPFQASCDALSGATFVAFTGREAISEPFVFNVFVSVAPGDVPERDDVIGSPLTLTVVGAEEAAAPQQTHGIVSAMESVREEPERSVLRLEVRPKLWFLGLSEHSRVFTEMTVEDVVKVKPVQQLYRKTHPKGGTSPQAGPKTNGKPI